MRDDGAPIFDSAFGKALSELPPNERKALFERLANDDNPLSKLSARSPTFALLEGFLDERRPVWHVGFDMSAPLRPPPSRGRLAGGI